MNTQTQTYTPTSAAGWIAHGMVPHFWTAFRNLRWEIGEICGEIHKPSFRARDDYALQLKRDLRHLGSRIGEGSEAIVGLDGCDRLKICAILDEAQQLIDWRDTKANNGARARAALDKIEGILAHNVDACTCVTAPEMICFADYHLN